MGLKCSYKPSTNVNFCNLKFHFLALKQRVFDFKPVLGHPLFFPISGPVSFSENFLTWISFLP